MTLKVYVFVSSAQEKSVTVRVFRIERNVPRFVGLGRYDSNSWFGSRTSAKQIISKNDNIKMINEYDFENDDDIRVIEL